ncbi:hypothetical protein [Antribacter gilvus]|nr:hypothetical protein [Antribacter gilvus]
MNIDAYFTGPIMAGVPALRDEVARKMPGDGDGDNKGDHCN